ncbi:MAG: carbohydrate ABC transporter permease [Sphaerochaetaceae bacterium]
MKRRKITAGLAMNYALFLVILLMMIVPLMILLSRSVSSERAMLSGEVGVLPDLTDLHFDSYAFVFKNKNFVRALANTISYTLIGTFAAVISTSGYAYALSKKDFKPRKFFLILSIFAMIFSGGLIPTYLVMTRLGLVNSFSILWMAGAFSVANMLIVKTSFEEIPKELEEAAVMDGAGQFTVLFRVYLPLSKAMLSVIALFYAVDYWNNYYTSLIYTTKNSLKSLQLVLKDIIYSASDVFLELFSSGSSGEVTTQSAIAACIVIATIPICLVYPFLQRNFAKGVLIGSVKG